jgi:hypothetical protein
MEQWHTALWPVRYRAALVRTASVLLSDALPETAAA